MTVTIKRLCVRCRAELPQWALYCIECGHGPYAEVDVKERIGKVSTLGNPIVQPTGIYNAPVNQTRLFSRFEVKLLYWLGKAALTIFLAIIGIFALIFLYILIASMLRI